MENMAGRGGKGAREGREEPRSYIIQLDLKAPWLEQSPPSHRHVWRVASFRRAPAVARVYLFMGHLALASALA